MNVNHPSFLLFLDNVTCNVLSQVTLENYFNLSTEKKISIQYVVFKLTKAALTVNTKLPDTELKEILYVLWKKNEEAENYEFASVLKDIIGKFDSLNETFKTIKKESKKTKTDIHS